jgi:DNA recombination protein RmuC
MAALLNSLQMGFKTLAIQKRSSEVFKVLGTVKSEFMRFEDVLKKAQNQLNSANKNLDELMGARTRKILKSLNTVTELPSGESENVVELLTPQDDI